MIITKDNREHKYQYQCNRCESILNFCIHDIHLDQPWERRGGIDQQVITSFFIIASLRCPLCGDIKTLFKIKTNEFNTQQNLEIFYTAQMTPELHSKIWDEINKYKIGEKE